MSTSSKYRKEPLLRWDGRASGCLFLFGEKVTSGINVVEPGWWGDGGGSEGLTLGVLRGADSAVTLHGHRVVVEGRHVGLAARQAHRHVTHLAVRAHAVLPVDVRRVRHGFLDGTHIHTHTPLEYVGRKLHICFAEKRF